MLVFRYQIGIISEENNVEGNNHLQRAQQDLLIQSLTSTPKNNREFKHDVYGRRQTANITSVFLFFSCYTKINHTKIEKCLLLFTANTNILIVLYRELKADGKSFIFAVCRLPFAVNVKLNPSNIGHLQPSKFTRQFVFQYECIVEWHMVRTKKHINYDK